MSMSINSVQADPVAAALDIMDQFEAPPIKHDADASADRLFFVLHFWPAAFDVSMQYIGYDVLHPGIISPIYPRNYNTRTPGDGSASIDVEVPAGGFSSRFRPGYAVACLNEIYKKKGLVSFDVLTDKGWAYSDVKLLAKEILPSPHDFPEFDRFRHRGAYLKDARAKRSDPIEIEVVQQMIDSNQRALTELTIVMKDTITNAAKALQAGIGRVTATDNELTFMMQAGMKVPKFMAEYSSRTDLIVTSDMPAAAPVSPAAESEAIQASLACMQEMATAFTSMAAQIASQQAAPVAESEDVASLKEELATLKAMVAALTSPPEKGKK